MKIYKRSSAMFKLILYNTIILIGVSSFLCAFLFIYFSRNYKDSVNTYNAKILSQMKKTVDEYVIKANEQLLLECINRISQTPCLNRFINSPVIYNIDLLGVYEVLKEIQGKSQIIRNMTVYSFDKNIAITTSGVKFLNDLKNEGMVDMDQLREIYDSEVNHTWVDKQIGYPPPDLSITSNIITFIQKYPFRPGADKKIIFFTLSIDEERLYNMVKDNLPIEKSKYQVMMLDREGRVISGPDKDLLNLNISEYDYIKQILRSPGEGFLIDNVDEIQTAINYVYSNITSWIYVVMMPYKSLYQWVNVLGVMVMYAFLASILLGSLLLLLFTNRFYSPIRQLVATAEKILYGPTKNKVNPANEFNVLDKAFKNLSLNIKSLESIVDSRKDYLKDSFLNNLIISESISNSYTKEYIQEVGIDFPYSYYSVLVVNIKSDDENLLRNKRGPEDGAYKKLIGKIVQEIENLVFPETKLYVFHAYDNCPVVILNHNKTDYNKQYSMCQKIIYLLKNNLSIKAAMGAGNMVRELIGISDSYYSAKKALGYSFVYLNKDIFQYSSLSSLHTDRLQDSFDFKLISDLVSSVRAGSGKDVNMKINQIVSNLVDYNYSLDDMQQIIVFIAASLTKMACDLEIPCTVGSDASLIMSFINANSIFDLKEKLEDSCHKLIELLEEKRNKKYGELIDEVIKYIKRNIFDEISLTIIADTFKVSESFISKVFKKETGIRFVDYCQNLKLEYARDILISSNKTVEEVSRKCGYSQPQYFIRKFKSKYGMTPKQYQITYSDIP